MKVRKFGFFILKLPFTRRGGFVGTWVDTEDMLGVLRSYICKVAQETSTVLELLVTDQREELGKKTTLQCCQRAFRAFFPFSLQGCWQCGWSHVWRPPSSHYADWTQHGRCYCSPHSIIQPGAKPPGSVHDWCCGR